MSKKITIIDYGMGNLYSVQNALRSIGTEPVVTSDAAVIAQAEKILLPGVGAFGFYLRAVTKRRELRAWAFSKVRYACCIPS